MATVPSDKPFLLQIHSLEDFEKFLKIIRSEKLSEMEITSLITKLRDSSESLKKAVKNSGG